MRKKKKTKTPKTRMGTNICFSLKLDCFCCRILSSFVVNFQGFVLRGPAAILFISRDTCSDSIAELFGACFYGVSHNDHAIRYKMGYRTDVPV